MFSHSAWHKKRFAENAEYREKIRAAWRRYRETHREEINERRRVRRRTDSTFRDKDRASKREWERRKRYREVYRISLVDYDAMRERQNGVCAICKRAGGRVLCVDHCHACGKVRGLLCRKCNSVLGFCDDSPAHLLAAAAYLRRSHKRVLASSMTTSMVAGETERSHASVARRHCRCAAKAL
jgi:hypothetical protein